MTQNPEKNLKLMLRHQEEVNIQIGLQILSNHPEKQNFATHLFALAYYHSNKHIRQEARILFKQLTCRNLRKKVNNFYQIFAHLKAQYPQTPQKTEQQVAHYLAQVADYEIIDKGELGNLTLYFTGMGFRFCWEQSISIWETDFTELYHLDLSGCYDPRVKQYLPYFTSITSVDLSENQLNTFPEEILSLPHLRVLNISKNRLNSLPDSLSNLPVLEYLDASENRLKHLPNSICEIEYLQYLNLRQNLLRKLPNDIGYTSYLNTLDVSHNLLAELPYSMSCFSDYHTVLLNNNLLSPSTWANEDHVNLVPHFWVNDGEWDHDFITAQATFSLEEDIYSHIVPPVDWNAKQASEIYWAEQVLESNHPKSTLDQWMEAASIVEDAQLDKEEKVTYLQQIGWHLLSDPPSVPSHLGGQFMEFYLDDDLADFLQAQAQVQADIWPWMYKTGLRVRYLVEGDFYDDEIQI